MTACRSKPRDDKQGKQGKTHRVEEEDTPQEEDDAYTLYNVKGQSSDPLTVQVRINNIPVDMEFDTGAAFSLLNAKTYQEIAKSARCKNRAPV